jgi:replicative DNA helicase
MMPESLTDVLARVDEALRDGLPAALPPVPTGFPLLDSYLGGGVRAGELCLLGGPQGVGKTFFALQILRHVVHRGGAGLYVTYEHDAPTVLTRLLAAEAGDATGTTAVSMARIRAAIEATDGGVGVLVSRLAGTTGGVEALASLSSYADRLQLLRGNGRQTGLDEIEQAVRQVRDSLGAAPLVVVDYLQKVADGADPAMDEQARVARVVEGLKDLALSVGVPVLAIVAAEKDGLATGTRLRTHHLRGSSALAYEPDVVLMLHEKYDLVARHHLEYDLANADRFRAFTVLSIEKNRSGLDHVDVEFRKRLDQGRFEAQGAPVQESLIDGRVLAR